MKHNGPYYASHTESTTGICGRYRKYGNAKNAAPYVLVFNNDEVTCLSTGRSYRTNDTEIQVIARLNQKRQAKNVNTVSSRPVNSHRNTDYVLLDDDKCYKGELVAVIDDNGRYIEEATLLDIDEDTITVRDETSPFGRKVVIHRTD